MRVAAIDVGTNSVHLLVVDIDSRGEVSIVEKARRQVELGRGGSGMERIAPAAFRRGLEAIGAFAAAVRSLEVDHVTAAATSAVREAANGKEFRDTVKEQTGIHVRVISGLEEARLVYLGVRSDLDFASGPAMLLDLGGGSLEWVLACPSPADNPASGLLASGTLPLGHIRLSSSLLTTDPISSDEISTVRREVSAHSEALIAAARQHGVGTVVGTSGAIRTLARMATLARGEPRPAQRHGILMSTDELGELVERMTGRKRSWLDDLPGMDPRRRHTLPAAAVVTHAVLECLGAAGLVTSGRSLRDGLIQDWILQNGGVISRRDGATGPRDRAVLAVIERFGVELSHAEQVVRFATALFDGTRELHDLGDDDRLLLQHAARLHDVGHHIAGEDHNRHGEYLLRHTPLYGFTAPEIEVLCQLVRYHRGSLPKRRHSAYGSLPRVDRRRVRILAGMLRLADALDRSHNQPISNLTVEYSEGALLVRAVAGAPAHLERWAADRRHTLLSNALDIEVSVRVENPPAPR